ncbi:hypothetical protein [Flavivirga sp. 57AJ16]|uniref:hypothetical protein n=1 Tax=Flavivirga sp. 57AJ16 TaxID=3025307 RepID=UPI0023659EAF|nr:hypothetical protein [Flavivirga sp. 57AJ16]MDD7887112.1 hypothetical protein [Flavivirga sp. 57AJ16]
MHKKLIIKAFDKARAERKKIGEKNPSTIHIAEDLSEYIHENEKFKLGERSFRDYKNEAENLIDKNEDINIKQLKVIIGLCKYLGFDRYEDFESRNKSKTKKLCAFFKKNRYILSTIAIISIILLIIMSMNRQCWMVWEKDRYVEVKFDTQKYSLGQMKLYNEDRIKYFKKIDADCNTEFFGPHREVKIWYGKNSKKELEFFTSVGLHPETGKTLDPITVYMIRKYICEDY